MIKGDMLAMLPPYKGNEKIIMSGEQEVPDIVAEVLEAHKYFANDYTVLTEFFWTGNIYETCELIYNFCRDNIHYNIEGTEEQTTKSPAAILSEAEGDCKHYAGFIAGVLDAINREFNAKINWCYRFASYNVFDSQPQHVFVVVKDSQGEIWIDPVFKKFNGGVEPTFYKDKKVNTMLKRISGVGNQMGFAWLAVAATALEFVTKWAKDYVPNYPIKSSNTFNKLKGIVDANVPLPPKSLAEAEQLLAQAIYFRDQEKATGDGQPANQTIIMMYEERIVALQNAIAAAKGEEVTPGGNNNGIPPLTAGASNIPSWVWIGGGAAALYFFTRNRQSRVSGKDNKGALLLLIGAGAVLVMMAKKKPAEGIAPGELYPETGGIKPVPESEGLQPYNAPMPIDSDPPQTNLPEWPYGGGGGGYVELPYDKEAPYYELINQYEQFT